MELEEAIKHWKNNIDKWWKKRPNLTNTDLIEEIDKDYKAVGILLNHLTKQEKMIELMAEYIMYKVPFTKETRCLELKEDARTLNSVKQYFEKKAEESE